MKLIKLDVNAFKGISPESPVVVDFSKSRWVTLEGDQAVGKTSLLEALLVACGHLSKENKDFINADSGKIDIDLEFTGNDRKLYHVRVTRSQFKLTYEGEALDEPIAKLKKLLGIPAANIMTMKFAPLKDKVKFLASYTKRGADEYAAELKKLKDGTKRWKTARADANRGFKAIKEVLENDDMYVGWEQSEAKYGKKTSLETISKKLDEAGKRSDNLIKAKEKVKGLKIREKELLEQLAQVQGDLAKGEKYIDDNKTAESEYTQIRADYDQAAKSAANYEKWQEIKRKKAEMDEFSDLAIKADGEEKDLLEQIKQLQAEILPDVRGVELVLEDEYLDGKLVREEDIYKDGVSAAKMSESEWTGVVLSIIKKNKCPLMVLDNANSLGSGFMKTLEQFHKDGGYVFAAQMNRETKELNIIYKQD